MNFKVFNFVSYDDLPGEKKLQVDMVPLVYEPVKWGALNALAVMLFGAINGYVLIGSFIASIIGWFSFNNYRIAQVANVVKDVVDLTQKSQTKRTDPDVVFQDLKEDYDFGLDSRGFKVIVDFVYVAILCFGVVLSAISVVTDLPLSTTGILILSVWTITSRKMAEYIAEATRADFRTSADIGTDILHKTDTFSQTK